MQSNGCAKPPPKAQADLSAFKGVQVSAWQNQPGAAAAPGIRLAAAGNELTSFTVELTGLPAADVRHRLAVGLAPLAGPAPVTLGGADVEAFQLVDLPVDVNRAAAVRHAGQVSAATHLPRALLPLPADGGRFALSNLRPAIAANPLVPKPDTAPAATQPAATQPAATARVWVDLRVPKKHPAGRYTTALEVLARQSDGKTVTWRKVASAPVELTVHNFSLPDHRNLRLVGNVSWEALKRHYGDDFDAVTPHLLTRADPKYAGTVRTLDALMALAQRNRVSLAYPRLQPTVKWPALVNDAPPDVRWEDFDALVKPWVTGTAFADGVGVGYWPLPEPDRLRSYDSTSRMAYWGQAASHFDQLEWLPRAAAVVEKATPGRVRGAEAIELSAEAAQLLRAHPRMAVSVPLEDDQVQLDSSTEGGTGTAGGPRLISRDHARRLRVAAAGLIATRQDWPADLEEPARWLRADLPGLVPTAGAGGAEQDVRLWAWLAHLRRADQVMFADPLPAGRTAADGTDPAALTWFYPGHWFGLDAPVPSVQLKWLRQAEQDFEYLHLARLKGEAVNALWMARLITKPVQVGLGQAPDAAYTLMTGTTDPQAWAGARTLLAKLIDLYAGRPDGEPDRPAKEAVEIEILQWARPQERPLLIGRTAEWAWGQPRDGAQWVRLTLGLDVYNAADVAPGNNQVRWTAMPAGWEVKPQPTAVPPLVPYRVLRTTIGADFNVGKTAAGAQDPVELELVVDSPSARFVSPLKLAVPVVSSDRREGRFRFDGRLDDWSDIDRIHDGPLVKMLSRPAVLAQALERAATPTRLYTNWAADNFYVGFAVGGIARPDAAGGGYKNFVDYEVRRAWGEDLCEVLVQPVYEGNTLGPILHVVVKPNGGVWVERKLDPRLNADPWEPFESTGTLYATAVAGEQWTGELAVPWKVLRDSRGRLPTLLRFNFSQHRPAAGESASWAGPVDFGRDDALTGLIHVKLPMAGNQGDAVQGTPGAQGAVER